MYEIEVDRERNRLYLKVGELEGSEPKELAVELMRAMSSLEPGWACITDVSEMMTEDPRHKQWLLQLSQSAAEFGIGQAVRVTGGRRMWPKALEKSAREAGYSGIEVETLEEAEAIVEKWSRERST